MHWHKQRRVCRTSDPFSLTMVALTYKLRIPGLLYTVTGSGDSNSKTGGRSPARNT